ncbi:MAG: hemolysin III family protein [Fusobacteria bacterium]|nr:hemolysin III family protein [Fusobacteriota bacterium]
MNKRKYTLGEEIFNSTSHAIGAILSILALIIMIWLSVSTKNTVGVISSIVFGFTLILLYTSSTLYHALTNKTAKKVFQIFDHCSIYLLIAGSYTPFALMVIGGSKGWIIFGIIWLCALLGIILNSINLKKFQLFSIILYVGMGWTAIFYIKDIFASLDLGGIILLAVGGVLYTLGIIFYLVKKIKYFHSIWHLFVLAGSMCHVLCVILFVL